jgi:hypothetical protein
MLYLLALLPPSVLAVFIFAPLTLLLFVLLYILFVLLDFLLFCSSPLFFELLLIFFVFYFLAIFLLFCFQLLSFYPSYCSIPHTYSSSYPFSSFFFICSLSFLFCYSFPSFSCLSRLWLLRPWFPPLSSLFYVLFCLFLFLYSLILLFLFF